MVKEPLNVKNCSFCPPIHRIIKVAIYISMKKDAIIGLLRYGGVSKSDFNMVKPDIAKENHRVWKFSALVLEVIFLIALIIAATVAGALVV